MFAVLRQNQRVELSVPVQPAPGNSDPTPFQVDGRNPLNGAGLVEMSPAFNERVGLDPFMTGVIVSGTTRRSIAARHGFQPGDRIVELMQQPVRDLDDLADILASHDGAQVWPLVVERRGRRDEASVRLY